jgi:hypothetical protein
VNILKGEITMQNQPSNNPVKLSTVKGRTVEVNFEGGNVSSNGGVALLHEIDEELGLTQKAAHLIPDPRDQGRITHTVLTLLRQRVYGICLEHEDLNDHDELRNDPVFQTAINCDEPMGSSPTLSRFEKYMDRKTAIGFHQLMIENFIQSFSTAPTELILDFDATDNPIYGGQIGRHFHGYYNRYCFLPLYVFCGQQLLVSYLRPSNQDGAKHAWAILSLLVKRFREEWPEVTIIFRGDAGFCRHKMLRWCESNNVKYIVGLIGNKILKSEAEFWINKAKDLYEDENEEQKIYGEFKYAAQSWKTERRIIVKAEHNLIGENTRFIVTNLTGNPQKLYEKTYCARGNMEKSIGEQISFYSDRTSSHEWWPNQFRLLLSALAYVLVDALRRNYLDGTQLGNCLCRTISTKLLKIGCVVIRNTRRVKIMLSSHFPYQDLFYHVCCQLAGH